MIFGIFGTLFSKKTIFLELSASFCRYSTTIIDPLALSCLESSLLGSTESLGFPPMFQKLQYFFFYTHVDNTERAREKNLVAKKI